MVHGFTIVMYIVLQGTCTKLLTLSKVKVLVSAKLQPASKLLRIIAELVVGVADASPKGFSNLSPAISTLRSTRSMGVKKFGRRGLGST